MKSLSSKHIIELSHVSKIYQLEDVEIRALDDVSMFIKEGEFVAIVGPSGSGKSTLMHIIGLLDKPTSGQVLLDDEDVSDFSEVKLAKLRNKKIGFIFQTFNLLPRTSSVNNVELTLIYSGVKDKERKQRAKDILERVGLKDRNNHFPSQLSGGQQQRVAIARALINNPILVIADEPTGNLDSKSSLEILNLLKKLNQSGHTIIMVTHDLEIANSANRLIKIKDGKVID